MDSTGVLTIGGSAGAVEALRRVVAGLPADLPASVLVSLHIGAQSRSALPHILSRAGPLPAVHPCDGDALRPAQIYVAPPGHHLLPEDGIVRLSEGPRVNGHRPAVDVMFAAAVRAWDSRVVAVVLSGVLDDGAVGAALVDRAGGRVLVQRPEEAIFDAMPRAALAAARRAQAVATTRLGARAASLLSGPAPRAPEGEELAVSESSMPDSGDPEFLSEQESQLTRLVCPDCRGALARVDLPTIHYYRCHVGHQFGPLSLEAAQRDSAESALWTALAMLEEHAALARSLAAEQATDQESRPLRKAGDRSAELADTLRAQLGPPAPDQR